MVPSFDAAWLDRQADLDTAFSEDFFLEPRALPAVPSSGGVVDVNARTVPSTARAALPFRGTFVNIGAILHAHGRAKADSTTHPVISEQPMIDVAQVAMPQQAQTGDRVHRMSTGEVFEVAAYLPEDPVRAWIHLSDAMPRREMTR